eukprot:TRINITY_DN11513_c0_g1_i1.p1 TRINITY_DN11513_c0_g1~~TRINITY_DN11513_c0_g1_i1.p1  ORF type:complete len:555 (-),score=23.92 TRINITY_DN11513_c0_g1_i1:378-2042(-)
MAQFEEAMAVSDVVRSFSVQPDAGRSVVSLFNERRKEEHIRSGWLQTKGAIAFQVWLVVLSLACYTLTPLLINYSVLTSPPSALSYATVTVPPVNSSRYGFGLGVTFAHRNGELFVERLSPGLASKAGVLEGDIVAQVWQGKNVIYSRVKSRRIRLEGVSIPEGHGLQAVLHLLNDRSFITQFHVNPMRDLQIRFNYYRIEVNKESPYLVASVIFVVKLGGAALCILLVIWRDPIHLRELRLILDASLWKSVVLACIASCCADASEVYAAVRIPASTYSVLLRLNFVSTAIFSFMVLGKRQTLMQSSILLGLTCLVFCYAQLPDYVPLDTVWYGFGEPRNPTSTQAHDEVSIVGLVCVFTKFVGVMVGAVLFEKAFNSPRLVNESVVVQQGVMFVVSAIVFAPFAFYMAYCTEWKHGFLGGGPIIFRHCSMDWTDAECASTTGWGVSQGWDVRTLMVASIYICREFVLNTLLREFSAVVRTLVAAGSVATTYAMSICFLGKSFNVAKFGLIIAIVLDIHQYAIAPSPDEPAPSTARTEASTSASMSGVELGCAV